MATAPKDMGLLARVALLLWDGGKQEVYRQHRASQARDPGPICCLLWLYPSIKIWRAGMETAGGKAGVGSCSTGVCDSWLQLTGSSSCFHTALGCSASLDTSYMIKQGFILGLETREPGDPVPKRGAPHSSTDPRVFCSQPTAHPGHAT